ncbi:hypothetical protein AB6C87_11715 [Vibrio splendidus]
MTKKTIRPLEGFNFKNQSHRKWLSTYLAKSKTHPIVEKYYYPLFDVERGISDKKQFQFFFGECENSAEGREIWQLLQGAWGKKLRREKQKEKGKVQYSFELSTEFGMKLQAIAKKRNQSQKNALEHIVNALTPTQSMFEVHKLEKQNSSVSYKTETSCLRKELHEANKKIRELESELVSLKEKNKQLTQDQVDRNTQIEVSEQEISSLSAQSREIALLTEEFKLVQEEVRELQSKAEIKNMFTGPMKF